MSDIKPIKCKDCGENLFLWYPDKWMDGKIERGHELECDNCGLLVSCPKCGNLSFKCIGYEKAECEKCGHIMWFDYKEKVEFT